MKLATQRPMICAALLAAGCGGTSTARSVEPPATLPPARAPEPPEPDRATETHAVAGAPPQPSLAPPSPLPPLRERLFDEAGPIPGMPGWRFERTADRTVCGGIRVVIVRSKQKLDPDQSALATFYAIQFPRNLDFPPDDEKRSKASTRAFNAYLDRSKKVADELLERFEVTARARGVDAAAKAALMARSAQATLHFAAMLARAPIPRSARTGPFASDNAAAFCDTIAVAAEPLVERAMKALGLCAEAAANEPDGWWTPLCSRVEPSPLP